MAEKNDSKPGTKKKKQKTAKGAYFDLSGEKITAKNRACPKCGAGVYMANHKDRTTCGKCGFTEWAKK